MGHPAFVKTQVCFPPQQASLAGDPGFVALVGEVGLLRRLEAGATLHHAAVGDNRRRRQVAGSIRG